MPGTLSSSLPFSPSSRKDLRTHSLTPQDIEQLKHRQHCPAQTRNQIEHNWAIHPFIKGQLLHDQTWYKGIPFIGKDRLVLAARRLGSVELDSDAQVNIVTQGDYLNIPARDETIFESNNTLGGVPLLDILNFEDTMILEDEEVLRTQFGFAGDETISIIIPTGEGWPKEPPIKAFRVGCRHPKTCPSRRTPVSQITRFGLALHATKLILKVLASHKNTKTPPWIRSGTCSSPWNLLPYLQLRSLYSFDHGQTWYIRLTGPSSEDELIHGVDLWDPKQNVLHSRDRNWCCASPNPDDRRFSVGVGEVGLF
ncbi:hypothetical protein DL96DRAFT_1626202 [Flagelloscypha sp. PMI_526]|nr:hypothetical protein DL96DRAFT_1626202 [Flagelloscypha sp. PMI_526]